MREVWTAGHSSRSAEEFVELLRGAGIERIIDVRSSPWSRRHPWHGRTEMERSLEGAGLEYVWLGAQLGGLEQQDYPSYQKGDSYRAGFERLLELARERPTAVICAEADPRHCHRRFIADDLTRNGFVVWHLIDDGSAAPHQPGLGL